MRLYKALLDQPFQSSQRNRRRRFAANAFGADLRLGPRDFNLRYLFAGSASGLENVNRLLPRGRIADADGLAAWVDAVLTDPLRRRAMGEAASGAADRWADLPERCADALLALVDRRRRP